MFGGLYTTATTRFIALMKRDRISHVPLEKLSSISVFIAQLLSMYVHGYSSMTPVLPVSAKNLVMLDSYLFILDALV